MICSVPTSTGSHPESSVPQTEGIVSRHCCKDIRKRDEEEESILDGTIELSKSPEAGGERLRRRRLDQPLGSIDSVLPKASRPCRTTSDGSSSPVDSIFREHSRTSSDSKVIPKWPPATKGETVYYGGVESNKTECWSGIRRTGSISAWMSDEIERRRNKHDTEQGASSNVIAPLPVSEVEIATRVYHHDFKSNTCVLNMPNLIIGYGPPESTVVSPTVLSKPESGQEGSQKIVLGWTRESMDAAWRRFLPGPPRSVEPHLSVLEAFDENSRDAEGSGSESGSIRTVRLAIAKDVEWGDEYESGDGSGGSNGSTGTVIHVGIGQ